VGILEKSSRLRIARFSLGMFTPEAHHSGSASKFGGRVRAAARVSGQRLFTVKELQQSRLEYSVFRPVPPMQAQRARSELPQAHQDGPTAKHVPGVSPQIPRFGHCRVCGNCARLRIIERSGARRRSLVRKKPVSLSCCASGEHNELNRSVRRDGGTQIARKDAMPHERGPLPVPPSEFCITTLADPKARFCCSLANPSTLAPSRQLD